MDIYKTLNNKVKLLVKLLEYEVYVKLAQSQKHSDIIDKEVLEKSLNMKKPRSTVPLLLFLDFYSCTINSMPSFKKMKI